MCEIKLIKNYRIRDEISLLNLENVGIFIEIDSENSVSVIELS